MENLTYVTGNYGKYISVKEKFANSKIIIKYFKCDLEEPNINDIEFISKEKAKKSFEMLKTPVFVIDSGFYIENYPNKPGYPGAFVKRSGVSSDIDSLLKVMENIENRNCYFLDCLTFYDGTSFYQFFGMSKGVLAKEKRGINIIKAKSNLWYIFIPDHCTKTLAEMSDYERNNRPMEDTSATEKFINWYKLNYLNNKKLVKKK